MSDDKKPEGRTAHLEKSMKEGVLKDVVMGISKLGDAVGYTQEKEYKGKTTEDLMKKSTPEKKRAGGVVGGGPGVHDSSKGGLTHAGKAPEGEVHV